MIVIGIITFFWKLFINSRQRVFAYIPLKFLLSYDCWSFNNSIWYNKEKNFFTFNPIIHTKIKKASILNYYMIYFVNAIYVKLQLS